MNKHASGCPIADAQEFLKPKPAASPLVDSAPEELQDKVVELHGLFSPHPNLSVGHRGEEGFHVEFNCLEESQVRELANIFGGGKMIQDSKLDAEEIVIMVPLKSHREKLTAHLASLQAKIARLEAALSPWVDVASGMPEPKE